MIDIIIPKKINDNKFSISGTAHTAKTFSLLKFFLEDKNDSIFISVEDNFNNIFNKINTLNETKLVKTIIDKDDNISKKIIKLDSFYNIEKIIKKYKNYNIYLDSNKDLNISTNKPLFYTNMMSCNLGNTYLFVYGTLKSNKYNNNQLVKLNAKFIEKGTTIKKYPLIMLDDPFPYLLDRPNEGELIKGEIWEIEDKYIDKLDDFEGAPTLYNRSTIDVVSKTKTYRNATVYFKAEKPLKYLSEY